MLVEFCANAQKIVTAKDNGDNTVTIKYSNDEEKDFHQRSSEEISIDDKERFLNGEIEAFAPKHLADYDEVALLGGGLYVNERLSPELGVRLSMHKNNVYGELELILGINKYPELSDATGLYYTYSAFLCGGWKFWHTFDYGQYVSILAGVGYGYHRTDSSQYSCSANSGFTAKLAVKYAKKFKHNFGGFVELGAKLIPHLEVNHQVTPEDGLQVVSQDMENIGPYASMGVFLIF